MSDVPFLESTGEDGVWTPLADVMSGLMIVFLLIAAVLSTQIDPETSVEEAVAHAHRTLQGSVVDRMGPHLAGWGAEIDSSGLAISFTDDNSLFEVGDDALTPSYQSTLSGVVRALVALVEDDDVRPYIEEVRIEGHTSSEWNDDVSSREAYLRNMELSQDRTRSVLAFVIAHEAVRESEQSDWIRRRLTANGLSSARPILVGGEEDSSRSRRVELRLQQSWSTESVAFARQELEALKRR